jgi:hypothetical protein
LQSPSIGGKSQHKTTRITFEKIKGKTLKKIILDLNCAPTRPIHFDAFYTGISRVRRSCDMKIMPIPPGLTLQHMKKLKPEPKLIYWQHGFDDKSGKWSRVTADKFKLQNKVISFTITMTEQHLSYHNQCYLDN